MSNTRSKEDAKAQPDDIITGAMRITGVKVAYYFICHTKLWLFSHNIALEKEHENVNIGKVLHEDRYRRDSKDVTIDQTISIDFIRKGESIVVHEIKKTKKMEEAHRWQMLFYLHYLKSKGVNATGEIHYPLISRKDEVLLSENDEAGIEEFSSKIRELVINKMPSPEKKKICPKCAYFEFCFGDET
ncbi:MAG: CRISPR-associated protein Cas4 [Candidatus Methanoperedens sp.]